MIHLLGIETLPQGVEKTLELGPKYCLQPHLEKPGLVSLVRSTVEKANSEEKERCILEGVSILPPQSARRCSKKRYVVKSLQDANLKLLLSDKQGGVTVAGTKEYEEKADEAIAANFRVLP